MTQTQSTALFFSTLVMFVLLVGFAFVALKVPDPIEENLYTVTGTVDNIVSECCKDINIRMRDTDERFYINRGVERGIDPEVWNQLLAGKEVSMRVIRMNIGLDLLPVAEMTTTDSVYFSSVIEETNAH